MTEFKTLKDIEFIENYSKDNYRNDHTHEIDDCCAKEAVDTKLFELQEEAKKWIKYLTEQWRKEGNYGDDNYDPVSLAFIHFFNITEEDLKWN